MLRKILISFLILLAVLIAGIAMLPDRFRVERSATLQAPVEQVFAQVNHLENWNTWSPWARLDPEIKRTFEGPQEGKGARIFWSGNQRVGQGSMTIVESQNNARLRLKFDFVRPFKSVGMMEFAFTARGKQTHVTWVIQGEKSLVAKIIGSVVDTEKVIGERLQQGFNNLQKVTQPVAARTYDFVDFLLLFALPADSSASVQDWHVMANAKEGIRWYANAVRWENDFSGSRVGTVIVTIRGKPLYLYVLNQNLEPAAWIVSMHGNRAGIARVDLSSPVSRALESFDLEKILRQKQITYSLIEKEGADQASSGTQVYEITAPKKKTAWLYREWSCGSGGCGMNLSLLLSNPTQAVQKPM